MKEKKNVYDIICDVIHKISKALVWVGAVALFLMALISFVNVFARYFLKSPIQGVQEVCEELMVIVLYCGIGYGTYKRQHICVDVITSKFNPKFRMILRGVDNILCLAITSIIAYKTMQTGIKYFSMPSKVTPTTNIPYWPFYIIVSIGCIVLALEFILDAIRWFIEKPEVKVKAGKEAA